MVKAEVQHVLSMCLTLLWLSLKAHYGLELFEQAFYNQMNKHEKACYSLFHHTVSLPVHPHTSRQYICVDYRSQSQSDPCTLAKGAAIGIEVNISFKCH